jgi:hypothetical protein
MLHHFYSARGLFFDRSNNHCRVAGVLGAQSAKVVMIAFLAEERFTQS